MTPGQYERIVRQRAPRAALRLGETAAPRWVLARAVRARQMLAAACETWQRIAPPELAERLRVVGVRGDVLLLEGRSPAVLQELRRRPALRGALLAAAHGLRDLELTLER